MDKKKREPFQSSDDMTEKSDSEITSVTSTDEGSHIEKEKTLHENDSVEKEQKIPPEHTTDSEKEHELGEKKIFQEEKIPISEKETKPIEKKIITEKKEEPLPVKKEVLPEAVVKKVKKPGDRMIKKFKRTSLILLLIVGLVIIGGFYAWTSGMKDLRNDNDYLIVVVFKEAEAASIYHKNTGETEIIEVTELEKIANKKRFFESAERKYGLLDRMIIIDVETLRLLSTDDYIVYQDDPDKRIYRDEMYNWIIGKDFPRPEIQGGDSPSTVNAKMLKSWLDHYQEKLFGNWGSNTIKVVLNGYRSGQIVIHPGNSALEILKYVAVEKIFLPV